MPRLALPLTVSRDPALDAAVRAAPGYPGASAILAAGDRAWLAAAGLPVPTMPAAIPLSELARAARAERSAAPAKKNRRPIKTNT